jgi:TolB-like protein
MPGRLSLKAVNAELAKQRFNARLAKGDGYFGRRHRLDGPDRARVPTPHILSRTTASIYRVPLVSLPELAHSIGVRWVIEGGVGSEGSRIYVKLRAVDAETDRKIWADVYDCEPGQLAEVSAQVAAKIEAAIQSQLPPGQ